MPINPRKIWEKGTLLEHAWRKWGDKGQLEKLGRKFEFPSSKEMTNADKLTLIGKALSLPHQASEHQRMRQEVLQELQEGLLSRLFNDDLVAYGYPLLPKTSRSPRRITSDFWDYAEVDWAHGTATNEHAKFHRIRVIDPGEFPELNLIPESGRPTHKALIEKAIARCLANGVRLSALTTKEKISAVRSEIAHIDKSVDLFGPGLGDDAIRKHLTAYLRKHRST